MDQPTFQPPVKNRKPFTIISIIAGVIAFAIGSYVAREGVKTLFGRSNPKPAPASAWAVRDLGGISVDAPFTFGPGPNIVAKLPQQVRDAIASFVIHDSGDNTMPRTSVSRVTYRPAVQVSLDGAASGAVREGAAAFGDNNPQFTSKSMTVDGLPARRVSYAGQSRGTPMHIEAVLVQDGQTIWQVQTLYSTNDFAADAARLVGSVHIKAGK